MTTVTAEAHIQAPVSVVFDALTTIEKMPSINPDVQAVEFLTEQRTGAGTRFRETRLVNGKPQDFDLELREYDAERGHARFVTDAHGTVWDTTMTVTPDGDGCQVRFVMDAQGQNLFARTMNFVMQRFFRQGMVDHIATLKQACEA